MKPISHSRKKGKKKHTIDMFDRLKMAKKAMRDTTHPVKPTVITDKKKKANKNFCRSKHEED
jgi:hypothetical protein